MVAALYGRADIVKLFIEKGADVNARTKSGATVLSLMKPYIGHEMVEVRKELKSSGAKE
jgi:ankyrin repeat protein